jgi:predicted Fe-S protein YdhL (DUF1289 family)
MRVVAIGSFDAPCFRPESSMSQTPSSQPLPERPDTPCVAVCSTTFDDVCRGCGRTVDEVAQWVFLNAQEREVVWQRILAQGYPRRNY